MVAIALVSIAAVLLLTGLSMYMTRREHKRLLLPLVELLDEKSAKVQGWWVGNLEGHFGGRKVKFHLEAWGYTAIYTTPSRFQVTLSCKSVPCFQVKRRSRTSPPGLNTADPELDKRISIDCKREEEVEWEQHMAICQQLTECARLPESKKALQFLMLWQHANSLILEKANDTQVLQMTFTPCQKNHFDVGKVRAILQRMAALTGSLEEAFAMFSLRTRASKTTEIPPSGG